MKYIHEEALWQFEFWRKDEQLISEAKGSYSIRYSRHPGWIMYRPIWTPGKLPGAVGYVAREAVNRKNVPFLKKKKHYPSSLKIACELALELREHVMPRVPIYAIIRGKKIEVTNESIVEIVLTYGYE